MIKELLKEHPDVAVVFLDVVMETSTAGLDVVKYLREELNYEMTRIEKLMNPQIKFSYEEFFMDQNSIQNCSKKVMKFLDVQVERSSRGTHKKNIKVFFT